MAPSLPTLTSVEETLHQEHHPVLASQFQSFSSLSSWQEGWWHTGNRGAGEGANSSASGSAYKIDLRH